MTLLRQYRIASFLLVLLAIVSFAIAELDFTMLFIGVVLATSSWYVTEGPRGRALPEWVANLLVVSLLAWTAYDFMMFRDLVEAMAVLGEFLLWLLVIKLFAHRTNSEDRQRLTLATLLGGVDHDAVATHAQRRERARESRRECGLCVAARDRHRASCRATVSRIGHHRDRDHLCAERGRFRALSAFLGANWGTSPRSQRLRFQR